MIIFLYGSDAYRLRQAKNETISRYKTKYPSGFNLFSLDLSQPTDINILEDSLRSSTFFNEHKLVVCKNTFENKVTATKLNNYIKEYSISNFSDITLMIIEDFSEAELVSKNKELFKNLSGKDSNIKIINSLDGIKLSNWVKEEFKARGCSIQNQALNILVQKVGSSSWQLINEIDKLAAYKDQGEITEDDISLLVSKNADLNIFNLIDALGAKNRLKALELVYHELKTGRDPYYILTMITSQFRNIIALKELSGQKVISSATSLGMHPFVARKSVGQGANFNLESLKKIYNRLLILDLDFKNGLVNPVDGLYNFIIYLS